MTPERRQHILDMANDEWVDRLPKDRSSIDFDELCDEWEHRTATFPREATDPEELHVFADAWNWDGGVAAMQRVIENPKCDAATALMIFWRAQPQDFSAYENRDAAPDYQQPVFDLLIAIKQRFMRSDFTRSTMSYDPHADFGGLQQIQENRDHDWIPRQMFSPILGGRR